MYPFSCVLWAIFLSFSLLFRSENASKTHLKSSHDKFKTASNSGLKTDTGLLCALESYKNNGNQYVKLTPIDI